MRDFLSMVLQIMQNEHVSALVALIALCIILSMVA
jgi:hypothetical protein